MCRQNHGLYAQELSLRESQTASTQYAESVAVARTSRSRQSRLEEKVVVESRKHMGAWYGASAFRRPGALHPALSSSHHERVVREHFTTRHRADRLGQRLDDGEGEAARRKHTRWHLRHVCSV